MPDLSLLVNLLQLAVKDRTQLALENIALRHQLAVYKRSVKRPNIKDGDRIFWLTMMRMLREWRNAFFRYKSIIGDRLRARHPGARKVEAVVPCNILNRMTELARPESYAIGA